MLTFFHWLKFGFLKTVVLYVAWCLFFSSSRVNPLLLIHLNHKGKWSPDDFNFVLFCFFSFKKFCSFYIGLHTNVQILVYTLMNCDICIYSCNHHPDQVIKHSYKYFSPSPISDIPPPCFPMATTSRNFTIVIYTLSLKGLWTLLQLKDKTNIN